MDTLPAFSHEVDTRSHQLSFSPYCCVWRCRGFYQYYQIGGDDDDNETDESESGREDELKSESFHSIFGFIMMIAEKTGWTKKQILNDFSFAELNFMLSDLPRLIKQKNKSKKLTTDEDFASFFKTHIE